MGITHTVHVLAVPKLSLALFTTVLKAFTICRYWASTTIVLKPGRGEARMALASDRHSMHVQHEYYAYIPASVGISRP